MPFRNLPSHSKYKKTLHIFLLILLCACPGCNWQNPSQQVLSTANSFNPSSGAIDLNSASREELMTIPGIGEKLADRIVQHRERHGPFRKPEHLILVEGFGEKRFTKIRHHVVAK